MHRIKSALLLMGIFGVFSTISFSLFGWIGALVVLGIGLVVQGLVQQRGAGLILRLHRAREVAMWEAPILHRIAGELAARAAIPLPQLMVYPSEMPNAFCHGKTRTTWGGGGQFGSAESFGSSGNHQAFSLTSSPI